MSVIAKTTVVADNFLLYYYYYYYLIKEIKAGKPVDPELQKGN